MDDNNNKEGRWLYALTGGIVTLIVEIAAGIWWASSITTTVNNISVRLQGVEAIASTNSADKLATAVTIAKIDQSNADIIRALSEDKRTLEAIENYLHDNNHKR